MDEQSKKERIMTMLIMALCSTLLTLVVLVPLVIMVCKQLPPQCATIDLQKIIEQDQSRILSLLNAQTGVNSEENRRKNEQLTIEFSRRLTKNIERLSVECRCILINKAALLSGNVPDYTELLMERMK